MDDKKSNVTDLDPKGKRIIKLIQSYHGTDPRGIELLDLLGERYLMSPCVDFSKPKEYAIWRDGQNSIIRMFINTAKKVKLTETNEVNQ